MRITWGSIHAIVFVGWLTTALVVGVWTGVLGGEQDQLQRQRGADRKAQLELMHQRDRLQALLERESSPVLVERAVRRLDLPLHAPRLARNRTDRD